MSKEMRVKLAEETLKIQNQGFYDVSGKRVDIKKDQEYSERSSFIISPVEGKRLVYDMKPSENKETAYWVVNEPTVKTILEDNSSGAIAALNFASAKNPGGGFLRGTMAQEEALAYSSGLYNTLKCHRDFYGANRVDQSAMYTDNAIYSRDVVFFRDSNFNLLINPVKCNILTLPAVNMRYVAEKRKDRKVAEAVMQNRMRLSLAILASESNKTIILGAYGCGVFKNNPVDVANWWRYLLQDEGYGCFFKKVIFAVLDDMNGDNITVFNKVFGC